jgi:hypothetical protein
VNAEPADILEPRLRPGREVIKAVPPPLIVATPVAELAAATAGCDASITTAAKLPAED